MGSFPERYNDSKCQHCLFTLRNSLNDAQTARNTCACDVTATFFFIIAASWVISPLMSGIVSSVLFVIIRHFILSKVGFYRHGIKT